MIYLYIYFNNLLFCILYKNLIRAALIKEEEKDRGINKSDNSRFVVLWWRSDMASRKRKKKETCAVGAASSSRVGLFHTGLPPGLLFLSNPILAY
jgi:hypothetical protein